MLTKAFIKHIAQLHQKKYRKSSGLFVVEGKKSVREFLEADFACEHLWVTDNLKTEFTDFSCEVIDENSLKKMSALVHPPGVLAVFKIPADTGFIWRGLTVVLDGIQDPGNLGTIIRLCDWFGVTQLICATETVDCFNPKVVQASMGSLSRVRVFYRDLSVVLAERPQDTPVFGAFMDGKNVYETHLPKEGLLVLGNEANGISAKITHQIQHKIAIPQRNLHRQTESLNVATAAAILLSEFSR
ncbi:MAG: RNA methyltransferase [Flavobacteriaceae bacterium]|nr:RNA methyltransferase [Flavobacteriaceae bacterium]